ncbi:MAG: phenylalanine--tRNA ligase subunit beta [Gammaproteobacteria bacterium]|nr:phenylalanine--tRNA ligase subunit beta [Gammaproteobacteria bacterium]
MKVSLDWLRSWANPQWDAATFAHRLTMAGFEVESIEPAAPPFSGIVVATIVECARHPDADKLSVCKVASGSGELLQVVCGAPNARAGLTTAFATVGATLPGGMAIKRAKLRGVESFGMLCSARELGLSESHEGILELPAGLADGQDLRVALGLDDTLLELNLTPNRGDALSVAGVAREVAAISGCELNVPAVEPVPAAIADVFAVRLTAPAAGPKFVGRVIRGVNPAAQTPLWMRERLRRAGLRAISPVVDVTNYVMLELGQPMHAYDLRRLDSHIEVRLAKPGEVLRLLDGKDVPLAADELVIADASAPVGLAGIMGGEKGGIAADTSDVFLEVAWFEPGAIAGRARRHGLQTDASQRFERGVDPQLQERAMERATRLLLEIAGGRPGPAVVTSVRAIAPRATVRLETRKVQSLLGMPFATAQVADILGRLGMAVQVAGDVLEVAPPSWRFDISIAQDLIEEVARIHGYDEILPVEATMSQRAASASEAGVTAERAALLLVDRGYQEAITYTFVDPTLQQRLFEGAESLPLANPISAELGVMRVSLWPGLVQALLENARRQQDRVRIFELGNRFLVRAGQLEERASIAGLAWGRAVPEQWSADTRPVDFYDLKADVEALLALAGAADEFSFVAGAVDCLHPGRSARIERAGATVGWIGQLHPRVSKELELKDAPYLFELDFAACFAARVPRFSEISRFPVIRRDLAIVVEESARFDSIRSVVKAAAGEDLRDLTVFDVYRGPGVESGRKSIALGLILQATSRTLTDADADAVMASVIARLQGELGAVIRE